MDFQQVCESVTYVVLVLPLASLSIQEGLHATCVAIMFTILQRKISHIHPEMSLEEARKPWA